MNWKHLSTSRKLNFSFGLMAIMIAFAGWQGIWGLSRFNQELQILYRVHTLGLEHLKDAQIALHRTMFNVHAVIQSKDATFTATKAEEIQKLRDSFEKNMVEFQNAAVSAQDRKTAGDSLNSLQSIAVEQDAVLSAILSKNSDQARQALGRTQTLAETLLATLSELEDSKHRKLEEAALKAENTYSSVRAILFTVVAISVSMAFIFGFALSRLITRPLQQTVSVLESVAQGDFSRSLDFNSQDEVGQMARALNRAIAGIRTALEEVREASVLVAEASRDLAHSSDQLSRGVQNQAASLDESAASLEEMTVTVRQNADNANRASKLAESARDKAEAGGGVVENAVAAMNEINLSSKRIADIISAIDEIAFQTNLLALNAAVEAARAGEQGRGFAVVAAEVRSLAQRSATAAREIKSLIQDSLVKVENGSELVNQSGNTLGQIVQSVKFVTDIVGEIAAASQEQAAGIDQVNRAVVQMDRVTQANAKHTEELTGTARSLAESAQYLRGLVSRFRLTQETPSAPLNSHKPSLHSRHRRLAPDMPAPDMPASESGVPSEQRRRAEDNDFAEFR